MLKKLPRRLAAPVAAALVTSAVVAAIALASSSGTQAVPAGSPPAPTAGAVAGQLVLGNRPAVQILSFSFGASNPQSGSIGGGGGAGKVSFSSLNMMKNVDASSSDLLLDVATGRHLPTATFTAQWGTGPTASKLVLTLKDVFVESVQHSGSGGSAPTESLSLGFTSLTWEFTDESGKNGSGGWDIPGNTGP